MADETSRRLRTLTLTLLGIGVAARVVRYATGAAVWGDEAMLGLNVATRDYAALTRALDLGQVAPVGFLWAERAVMDSLGTSEWAVRLLPFLAAVGALAAFWTLARRAIPPLAALLAVGTLAVARWPVSMAGTLKPYSGDLFWSTLLMALAVWWRHNPRRVWPLAALAAAVPVALGMSYPTVFVAGAVAVYLLPGVWRSGYPRAWGLYAVFAVLMLGTFAAAYRNVASQASDPRAVESDRYMREYWAGGFPPRQPLAAGFWFLDMHTGRLMALPIGDQNAASTVPFLLFLGGAWGCWKARRRGLLVLCVGPMALNLLAAVLGAYPYGACARISQHLVPGICLMIGMGWAGVVEWAGAEAARRRLAAAVILLAGFGLGQVIFDLARPEHGSGAAWARGVLREVGRNVRPGDLVVVGNGTVRDASFEWYAAKLGGMRADDFTPDSPRPAGRVWFVVLGMTGTPTEEARLEAAIGPGWETLERVEYQLPPNGDGVSLACAVRCLSRVAP